MHIYTCVGVCVGVCVRVCTCIHAIKKPTSPLSKIMFCFVFNDMKKD